MHVVLTGASGLIGSDLKNTLESSGHHVTALSRNPSAANHWDIKNSKIHLSTHTPVDCVIHLAGENIASGRWTAQRKQQIRASRMDGTALIAQWIAQLSPPPQLFISASAVGFYGNRIDGQCDEKAAMGSGFLAEVCRDWEEKTTPVTQKGIRTVNLRIGMVLAKNGGALAKMLLPFKLGFGGKIGNGKQMMSWIGLNDLRQMVLYILETPAISGAVNAVAPHPVSNAAFTKTLGKIVRRPTLFPVPKIIIAILFGEMGKELLLSGNAAIPKKMVEHGFKFKTATLYEALKDLL